MTPNRARPAQGAPGDLRYNASNLVNAANIPSPPATAPMQPHAQLTPGTVLADRYCIVMLLGAGSTGTVYAAEHVQLHKKYAIKILHPELNEIPSGVARFEREAMATAHIDHPNVAASVDFGRLADDSMYLVLEYVDGRSLRSELPNGPLPIARALRIARQVASSLVAAQALGIVHRDLKPENIMLVAKGDDRDFVKVLDFGLARVPSGEGPFSVENALTKAGAVFGTPEYMAPEQGIGQKVDSRADLYALGVILFEMIAGVRPYDAKNDVGILAQQITSPVPTFRERAPEVEVPRAVERLVYRLLTKGLADRFQRADEVVTALDALLDGRDNASDANALEGHSETPLPAFELNTALPGLLQSPETALPPPGLESALPPVDRSPAGKPPAGSSKTPDVGATGGAAALAPQSGRQSSAFREIAALYSERSLILAKSIRKRMATLRMSTVLPIGIGLICLLASIAIWFQRPRLPSTQATSDGSSRGVAGTLAATSHPPSALPPATSMGRDAAHDIAQKVESNDPVVLIDLAQSKLKEGRDLEAVGYVARVLPKHPDQRNNEQVARILYQTANSTVKGVADTTFSLLTGIMAAPGADILHQLSLDRSIRSAVRSRARTWQRSPQFRRAASGALKMAVELRHASTCEAKHSLLPMASKVGEKAALLYLRELTTQSGCGFSGKSDCYPCLRTDSALKDAISNIESRLNH